ncbi:uncharacterized protein SETTUDRAFT_75612, partial [Exserohilum turcica Et28A]
MSTHTVRSDIILQGQNNWELWIFIVKRIAEAGDVWEYIDPNKPANPLQKPVQPTRPAPTELLYHIKDKATVYDQIKTLQELYSPTTSDMEYRVQKDYEAAKVLHARRANVEDWCSEFLTAYSRAKQLDLPEVHGFRAHKDLLRAIKQVDAAYAASASLDIFKAEENWNSDRSKPIPHQSQLPTVIAEYLRYYRTTYSRKVNIHGGAFGATISGQPSPYVNKKRSRDEATKPTKPCLCGDSHFWGQCPYIDTAL